MSDWNTNIIKEFRENEGKVQAFAGATMVLLHTTGAKSGEERDRYEKKTEGIREIPVVLLERA